LVATILSSENAKKKAVHAEENPAPDEDSKLLDAGVSDSGDLKSKRNGSKGEHTVWKTKSAHPHAPMGESTYR